MFVKTLLVAILMIAATFQVATAQTASVSDKSAVAGKWAGAFEGSSSGKFELILNQDAGGKLTGQVIMLADDGNRYPIDLKTVVWENGQLNASYENPSDGSAVNFTGKISDSVFKGTWQSNAGQDTGTWQASRGK